MASLLSLRDTTLTVRQKLWMGTGLITVCACSLGFWLIWLGYADYRRTDDSRANMALFRAAILASDAVSSERSPGNEAISETGDATDEALRRLEAARLQSDLALDELANRWNDVVGIRLPSADAQFEKVRASLEAARREVDFQAHLPRETREQSGVEASVVGMFAVVDALQPVIVEAGQRLFRTDPAMADAVVLTSMLARMREYADRISGKLLAPMVTDSAMSLGRQIDLGEMMGRVVQTWDYVSFMLQLYREDEHIGESYRQVATKYFGEGHVLIETMIREGRGRGNYSIGSAEFTRRMVPYVEEIENLRDAIFSLNSAQIQQALDDARWRMWASAVITFAILAVLLAALVISHRGVFGPLLYARDEIVALARDGGGHALPPRPTGSAEIQALFGALDILRATQRRRERLEKERELLSVHLKQQAQTDALTELQNRRALEMIGQNLAQYSPHEAALAGLILLDVDHFKAINDAHGHPVGDVVLQQVAQTLKAQCGEADIVARYGGEEFAVLVLDTNVIAIGVLAERIREACEQLVIPVKDDVRVQLTVSAGAVVGQRGLESWQPLVELADAALYRAKRAGRNRVVVDPGVDAGQAFKRGRV